MGDTVIIDASRETLEAWEFPVQIGTQQHTVTVQKAYWRKLTNEKVSARELVFRSILFLLEREPKEQILSEFDLEEITEYFPEYEKKIVVSIYAP
jgi:hypothetical protein